MISIQWVVAFGLFEFSDDIHCQVLDDIFISAYRILEGVRRVTV